MTAVREAMIAFSHGDFHAPLRTSLPIDSGKSMLFMPGGARELGYYGAKLISLHDENATKGLPTIQGVIVLFDFDTGEPKAMIDGASVTGLRTAAASALATDLLARPDASTLGIFGAGAQAATHIDAIAAVRSIDRVLLWARNSKSAAVFAEQHSRRTGLRVEVVSEARDAARCDILCTVTASEQPLLKGEWVEAGTHINLVGSHSLSTREANTALIQNSRVFVDSLASTTAEGGDVMIPVKQGRYTVDQIIGEIGEVATGGIEGRLSATDVTLYNSLGVFAQDLYSAAAAYRNAKNRLSTR